MRLLLALFIITTFTGAQETLTDPVKPQPPIEPRLLGKISAGSMPPPPPPKMGFVVDPSKVIDQQIHHDGQRNVTTQRITPLPVAPPIDSSTPSPPLDEATREALRRLRGSRPTIHQISMGVTIYTFPDGSLRSHIRYRIFGRKDEFALWSNADFSLLPSSNSFLGNDGESYQVMMVWTPIHIDQISRTYQRFGKLYQPPQVPELPPGEFTFTLTPESSTDPNAVAPIDSLHEILKKEGPELRAARDKRVQAAAVRKAQLEANPPKPQDVTINYWITETPAPARGGGR